MSKRIEITGQVFNDVYVLNFIGEQNTQALYKCLCMLCNETFNVTYSNLVSQNTKSCQKCGNTSTSYRQECEVLAFFKRDFTVAEISRQTRLNRKVINRIKDDNMDFINTYKKSKKAKIVNTYKKDNSTRFISRYRNAQIKELLDESFKKKIVGYQLHIYEGAKLKIYSHDTFDEAYAKYNKILEKEKADYEASNIQKPGDSKTV